MDFSDIKEFPLKKLIVTDELVHNNIDYDLMANTSNSNLKCYTKINIIMNNNDFIENIMNTIDPSLIDKNINDYQEKKRKYESIMNTLDLDLIGKNYISEYKKQKLE
jgi:predicted metalloendopeptidase